MVNESNENSEESKGEILWDKATSSPNLARDNINMAVMFAEKAKAIEDIYNCRYRPPIQSPPLQHRILDETETRLDDHITFYDNGTIRLDNDDDLNMYSRMMLYVIAQRLAYEGQCVDTPQVTGADLRDRFKYTKVDLMLFLHEAGDHLTPAYRIGGRDNDIPYRERSMSSK